MTPLRVILFVVACPLLLFLPGHLLLRWLRRESAAGLPLADTAFQSILTSTLLTSALALPLAEMGVFSLPLLLGLLAGLTLLLLFLLRRLPRRPARPCWSDLLPLSLALLSAGLGALPHEYILGSGDPGSYINIGVSIAETGGIIIHNPEIAQLPDMEYAKRELLFPDLGVPDLPQGYQHLPAFYIADLPTGTITPQFYHLLPVWIAIGYALLGLRGALFVVPLFGLLATLAVYFAGKALFGRWAGFLGGLLLSVNLVQVWFSRYPTSEIPSQYWVFSLVGMLALYLPRPAEKAGPPAAEGVLAAGALAAFLHTRLDAPLALVPALPWLLYLLVFRRQEWKRQRALLLILAAALAHLALYILIFAQRYALRSLLALYHYLLRPAATISAAALTLGICLGLGWLAQRGWLRRHETAIRWTLLALIAAVAIWAYFVWPALTPPQIVDYPAWPEPIRFVFENDENVVRLGWYLTPWGLLLGLLGILAAVRREPAARIVYPLAIFFIFGAIYTYQISDSPVHINAMRRYVPIVIPVLALGAAYAVQRVRQIFRSPAGLLLAGALFGGLLVLTARTTWPLLGHRDYAGAVEQVTALAGRFDENALLLYTDVEYGTLVGMPLHYIFDRPGFVLQQARPDPARLAAQIRRWEDQGKEVFLVVADGRSRLSWSDFTFQAQGVVRFTLPRLEHTLDRRPERVAQMPFVLEIYRLRAGGEALPAGERFVDVGEADYPFVEGGFYGKEIMPEGITFRWTREDAEFVFPGSWFSSTQPLSLTLSLGHNRPPDVAPPQLEVWLEDHLLARFTAPFGFQTVRVPIPADIAGSVAHRRVVHLRLVGDVWVPATSGIADERPLGVFVDWARID